MTANALPKTGSRHFRNGVPALVIGVLTLLLIGYGALIQPSRLNHWYQSQQAEVSSGFSHAVAADNPERSVKSAVESARRGRIVHQRLLQMSQNSPESRLSASHYLTEVVADFQNWLQSDQGFISKEQRESIVQLCSEFSEESKSTLFSLLKDELDTRAKALKILASDFAVRSSLPESQIVELRSAMKDASNQLPSDAELALYSAELEIDATRGALTAETQQYLDQLTERFGSERQLRAILIIAIKSLSQNSKLAVRLVEKALSDKSIANASLGPNDQMALIKANAIVANWSEINQSLPALMNKSMSATQRHYLGSHIAHFFEMLMESKLPSSVPVWCERSDACQNLVLQLDPNSPLTSRRLMGLAAKNSVDAECLSQTLLASNLFPLKGVIKILSNSGDLASLSDAERAGPDWNLAATIASQVCLTAIQADRANASEPAEIVSRLTQQFPSNGNVWYVDAIVKTIQGELKQAIPSAQNAQKLLGDLPSIRSLLQELGAEATAESKQADVQK